MKEEEVHGSVPLLSPAELEAEKKTKAKQATEFLVTVRGKGIGRPWMAVVGAMVAMLGLGAQSAWGTLSVFVSKPGLLGNSPSQMTIWAYAAAGAAAPASMLVAPLLHARIGFSATALVGALAAAAGILSAAAARSLWALILTFGVVFGAGNGLVYNSCVVAAQSWFPRRRGIIGGLVLACFAASGFIYNIVSPLIANPTRLPTRPSPGWNSTEVSAWAEAYHEEMSKNVPRVFVFTGSVTGILGVIGSLLVHPSPSSDPRKRQQQQQQSKQPAEEDVEAIPKTSLDISRASVDESLRQQVLEKRLRDPAADIGPLRMLRTPQFYMLYVVYTFGVTATLLVLGSFSDFAKREAAFDAPFSLVGGLAALSNAVGRLSWGALADLIDYRRTLAIILTLVTILLGTYAETKASVIAWALATCSIWFCYGGILALLPTATADAFGAKFQSRNYSILYTSLAIGSLVQAMLLTSLLEFIGSYRILFWITAVLSLFADLIMIAYKPPGKGKWFAIHLSYAR